MTTPRATLGSWLDRIVIGAVGLIIIWFVGKLEMLTTTVQQLCVTMAANGEQLRSANQQGERNRVDIDKLRADYETHPPLGPDSTHLTQTSGESYGRDGFYIHSNYTVEEIPIW